MTYEVVLRCIVSYCMMSFHISYHTTISIIIRLHGGAPQAGLGRMLRRPDRPLAAGRASSSRIGGTKGWLQTRPGAVSYPAPVRFLLGCSNAILKVRCAQGIARWVVPWDCPWGRWTKRRALSPNREDPGEGFLKGGSPDQALFEEFIGSTVAFVHWRARKQL